ncbi:MAG: vitamin B12-dependent ribonucleotide reductase, partial [Planctomycetota bacterium]
DCDTTGVEPDLALVKYKRLAGGGTLKLVNRSVPRALRALGYDESGVAAIVAHLESAETVESAPGLKDEHLGVFDCAIRPPNGERAIRPEGHLLMMAAVQPFLSGGISKTLNLPEEITAEEIGHLFLLAARLGLKSLAVFRENSKGVQPLGTHCVVDKTGDGCCG